MDRAIERLVPPVTSGELIAIFGDYDVDRRHLAARSAISLCRGRSCRRLCARNRIKEGYGPNAPALLKLKAGGRGGWR